ncbi:TetR/AcrR family transcriptional regulator [Methylovirgula sp. 4M-Z18]|uniref:TetR/AcrR family transcriptional regulator n=1 Tax=Methylovirgula sp. 4M-Z18 TaxID=2293567 RepID=UPI000E2F732E|nr:TetR/AcrR family transcriptional regulator [Methylovirgula sp. 4M-Z18]RFB79905.1 TetR/AcrR family transcriptional regulator [Methylovirgula sp. 4M-Z18]
MWSHKTSPQEKRGYHHGRLKDALVEAARALIAERGTSGFTLTDAAKLAGVTTAAPYRHFADRNALLDELARRGFDMFNQRLKGAWNEGQPDPATALRRMGSAYLAFAREEPGLYNTIFSGSDLPPPSADTEDASNTAFAILEHATSAVLRQYGAPTGEAHRLAYEIWAMAHGIATLSHAGHLREPDCDPSLLLYGAVNSLMEMAVRRALGTS